MQSAYSIVAVALLLVIVTDSLKNILTPIYTSTSYVVDNYNIVKMLQLIF